MSIIYCDESGNSGERLLDKDQPLFVLGSNDFGKSEAISLLEHVRSPQGAEPKFKTLKRTQDGIRRLIGLFADPRLNINRVAVDVYHKRYMVVTKMVDLIAETLMHEMGEDLYRRGANIAMSNMLYYCMPAFCGEEKTDRFLQSFVDLMRSRTEAHAVAFFEAGSALVDASSNKDFKNDLRPFIEPELFNMWFDGIDQLALDPAIPALFQHINEWGKRKPDRFRVIHDGSKPVLASQDVFHSMMARDGESLTMVGYDRRKFKFPLRALSLEQGDSIEYPQIQVADLCAGA
ncbi:MAG: DUF3800 domain-containing protein, partial [Betaproteobacteria bacterium]|nr:DUF3800 domain-containing protein [Betaproteobacteria bacterium]